MVPTTNGSQAVTLGTGPGQSMTTLDVDFGFAEAAKIKATSSTISTVTAFWRRAEPSLAGVTVILTGTDSNGNPVTKTATTNSNGEYSFLVPQGNYAITYNTGAPIPGTGLQRRPPRLTCR